MPWSDSVADAPHPSPLVQAVIDDALWRDLAPLLPRRPGRQIDDRTVLAAVVLAVRTGASWPTIQGALAQASFWTCRRRLQDWQIQGVWPRIEARLRAQRGATRWDWTRLARLLPPAPATATLEQEADDGLRSTAACA
ncbi:MAG: hypothetical protein KatS3mg063_2689 [Tepidiforma sp.]|uniref:transposase n=1 Tax=Tepidiforma sp. TaxID=2682230 RepID=UPI0017E327F6|nr:transposase [Tepidiforma sp.]GIW16814.1 MAG: hypothetical protein KatS3mg063_2667 [Tepidiforma sp.]GIW16836.1 MAG: hypothetical protein KatS3mg063_2689 [Tepidiforma sp.]